MANKIIISCAVTGSIHTPTMSDALPITPDQIATQAIDAAKALTEDPKLVNARGPEGSTPFMYASLYGDAAMLEQLLKKGANPNLKNDAGATALMWAAMNLEKTRVLIAHGAEVNAISEDLRTPLMIAAGLPTGSPIVTLLLDHGAKLNPTKNPDAESSPLIQAALAADPEMIGMLIDHGADVKASQNSVVAIALMQDCQKCADLLKFRRVFSRQLEFWQPSSSGSSHVSSLHVTSSHVTSAGGSESFPWFRQCLLFCAGWIERADSRAAVFLQRETWRRKAFSRS